MPKSRATARREGIGRRETKRVTLPLSSLGPCRYARKKSYNCGNFSSELANGLCVKCWDRSMDDVLT